MKKLTILPGSDSARLLLGVASSDAQNSDSDTGIDQPFADTDAKDTDMDATNDEVERFELPVTTELRRIVESSQGADDAGARGDVDSTDAADSSRDGVDTRSSEGESTRSSQVSDDSLASAAAASSTSPAAVEPTDGPSANPKPVERPKLTISPREIQKRIRHGESVSQIASDTGMATSRIEPFAHPILAERARVAKLGKTAHPVRKDGPSTLTLWEVLATSFAARGSDLSSANWDAFRDDNDLWIIAINWVSGHATIHAEWSYHPEGDTATVVARNEMAAELIDPDFGRSRATRPATIERAPLTGVRGSGQGTGGQGSGQNSGSDSAADADAADSVTGVQEDSQTNANTGARSTASTPDNAGSASSDGGEVIGIAEHRRRHSPSPMLSEDDHPLPHPSLRRSRKSRGRQDLRRGSTDLRQPAFNTDAGVSEASDSPDHSTGDSGNGVNEGTHTTSDRTVHQDRNRDASSNDSQFEDSFLEYPESEINPAKRRRRKAVTPHWEDVLLGVRPKKDKEKGPDKK